MSKSRQGRPRKPGHRYRGGRVVPSKGDLVPVEIEQRRRELLGDQDKHSTAWRRDPKLGDTLGHMRLRGEITDRQYEAGQKVAAVWRAWATLAECPGRHARAADLPIASDVDREPMPPHEIDRLVEEALHDPERAEKWRRLTDVMAALRARVTTVHQHALAWSLLETVCADDVMPPRLTGDWPQGWTLLRAALDEAAKVFKIPGRREAA